MTLRTPRTNSERPAARRTTRTKRTNGPRALFSSLPLAMLAAVSSCYWSEQSAPRISASASYLLPVSSGATAADGRSGMEIEIHILDRDRHRPVAGAKVRLVSDDPGVELVQPESRTNRRGTTVGMVYATLPGEKRIRAVATNARGSVELREAAIVRFYDPDLPETRLVSPQGVTNTYTGFWSDQPWGITTLSRYQQVHEDLVGHQGVIKGMAFRHGEFDKSFEARNYEVTLTLGDSGSGSADLSETFDANWRRGGVRTVVLSGQLDLPAIKAQLAAPAPFDAPIAFARPVYHSGAHPLLWELRTSVTPRSQGPAFEAGPGESAVSSYLHAGIVGKGCRMSGKGEPLSSRGMLGYTDSTQGRLYETLGNGPTGGIVIYALGDTRPEFGGVGLPLDLVVMGSPGCFLNINLWTYFRSFSVASLSIPFTYDPVYSGLRFRSQWAADDNGVVKTSNGLEHTMPYTVSTWPSWSLFARLDGNSLPKTGVVHRFGLITQFWM